MIYPRSKFHQNSLTTFATFEIRRISIVLLMHDVWISINITQWLKITQTAVDRSPQSGKVTQWVDEIKCP